MTCQISARPRGVEPGGAPPVSEAQLQGVDRSALKKVAAIDPEDLQMHYTAMLAYRGIGDIAAAEREQKLFQRFKAEESAQAITAKRRLISPEDNNERQAIHDHESMDLKALSDSACPTPGGVATVMKRIESA